MKKMIMPTTLLAFALLLFGCASGSHLVTGTARPSIEVSQVRLLTEQPEKYEIIGIVRASSDMGLDEQGRMNRAAEELKKQAASIGANAVIIGGAEQKTSGSVMSGYSTGYGGMMGVQSGIDSISLSGQAIFIE